MKRFLAFMFSIIENMEVTKLFQNLIPTLEGLDNANILVIYH